MEEREGDFNASGVPFDRPGPKRLRDFGLQDFPFPEGIERPAVGR